jgi:CheY-like chemotaxis protein
MDKQTCQILVIDDDPYLPRIVESCLTPPGRINLRHARDGRQGLQMAEADPPDLILLDFSMPVMDGLETLRRLRAYTGTARTPVVAITGSAYLSPRCAEMVAACDAYLPKPLGFNTLRDTLSLFLPQPPALG